MATRKDPGGGKKPPRKPVTSVAKPKAKVTKSRGSNTAKQVGDQNMREAYNSNRDSKYTIGLPTTRGTGAKSTVADAKKSYSPKTPRAFKGIAAKSRAEMRKGGKGR